MEESHSLLEMIDIDHSGTPRRYLARCVLVSYTCVARSMAITTAQKPSNASGQYIIKGDRSADCATNRNWKPSPMSLCAVWATPSKIAETTNGIRHERALVAPPAISGLPEKRARATNDRYTGIWI